MITKPKLHQPEQRANEVYRFLKANGVCTKEQICEALGWKYNSSNDRRCRDILALLGTRKPIVAVSDRKGYKIAESPEEAQHAYNEIRSRISELEKRLVPLENYLTVGSLY